MTTSLVSVLIPCYNAERWISKTLESALSQTWANIEVIVVDDGSPDRSLEIAKSFESARIKVISQHKQGAAAARNLALREAQGEFVQFLDADDLLAPGKIEIQIKRLMSEPSDALATGSWVRFNGDEIQAARFHTHPDFRDYDSAVDWLIQAWNGRGTMPVLAWLIPRRVIDKTGPWIEDLSLGDDTEYFTRVTLNGTKIVFCPEALGYYRSGNPSLSARRDREALESYFRVCELCTQQLLAFEDSARTREACANLWQFFAHQTYPDAVDLVDSAESKVKALGGTSLKLEGGLLFSSVLYLSGWKTAKRIQRAYYSLRYP